MTKQHSTPGRRATKDGGYTRRLKVRKGHYIRTVKDRDRTPRLTGRFISRYRGLIFRGGG